MRWCWGGDFIIGGTGNLTFSNTGASALTANRQITVTTSGVNATFAQAFSGAFSITKAGAGTLTLSGNNTHTGGTTISAGTLIAVGSSALGTGTIINNDVLIFRQDSGFSVANAWSSPDASSTIVVDRVTPGAANNWTITQNNNISNGRTLNFQKGANVTSGTPTISFTSALYSQDTSATVDIVFVPVDVNLRINGLTSTRNRSWVLSGTSPSNEVYGAITDGGSYYTSVTKIGGGIWTLSGLNTYRNPTSINGGTLRVATGAGTRCTSPVTIANTAGCIFGVQLAAANGQWASSSTLTVGGANSEIQIDYGSTVPSTSTSQDPIKVTTLTVSGIGTLKILSSDPSKFAVGSTYPLINGTTSVPAAIDPYEGLTKSLPVGVTGRLITVANHVQLVIEGNTHKYWNSGSADWDSGTPWAYGGTPVSVGFNPSDTVYLGDGSGVGVGVNPTITIGASVSPTAVIMNSTTHDYTIAGSPIAAGSVTVNAPSRVLTLTGDNTYVGTTTVSAGTLLATKATGLPGYDAAGKVSVASGATLAVQAGGAGEWISTELDSLLGATTAAFASGSKLGIAVTTGNNFSYANNIGATLAAKDLVKSGAGTLTLSGANTYSGTTTISASGGMLQFANEVSLYNNTPASWTKANIIVNSGGTLALNVGGAGEFTAGDITTLLGNLTGAVNNNGLRSGSVIGFDTSNASPTTFTVADIIADSTSTGGGAIGLKKLGANTLELSGASTYTGATTVHGGTLSISSIDVVANANPLGKSTVAAANLLLGNGATLKYTGGAASCNRGFTINGTAAGDSASLDASGTGAINLTSTASPAYGTVDQTRTLILTGANTGNNTLAANIGDNTTAAVSLTKTGDGKWVLSGANTYTGTTTINGGTLALGGSDKLPNGSAVYIGSATLDAATFADTVGTLDVTGNAVINLNGGTLAFADSSGETWAGSLTITGTFVSGSSLRFTSSSGLSGTQLGQISATGWKDFGLDASGYLTAVEADRPTLASIVSNKDGFTIPLNTLVTYTVTFSEDMDASTVSDADFGNAGTAALTINSVTETSANSGVFTVQATPTGGGSLQLKINQGADLQDSAANTLDTSSVIADDTTITVEASDSTPPVLDSIVDDRGGVQVAPNLVVTYTVTFSEDMDETTVAAADFGNAGTASVSIGAVTEPLPGVFSVPATPTSTGTLQLKVNQGADLKDVAGNALVTTAAIPDDTTITVEGTLPTLTSIVDDKSGGPIKVNTLVTYTVTFSEDMNAGTVTGGDFENAGSSTYTMGSVTETTPGVFSVEVTPTGEGTLQLQIKQSVVLKDIAGNELNTGSALPDDTILAVDGTDPTLASSDIVDDQSGEPAAMNALVTYTVTFSEDMDALTVTTADFDNAGTASITMGTVSETSAGVFEVQVTPTTTGTLQLKVKALAELRDVAGNTLDTASAIADDTILTVTGPILTWDANGATDLRTEGAGVWKAANQWWTGSANQDWVSIGRAVFGNGGTGSGGAVTLASPTTVHSLTLDAFTGTYTLGTAGQAITLNTGITMNSGSGIVGIISPITLGGSQTWANNAANLLTVGPAAVSNGANLLTITGSGNTTVSGVIGSGSGGLTKNGNGTLTLSAENTYTGGTTVDGGVLALSEAASDGEGAVRGTLTINGAQVNTTTADVLGYSVGTKVDTLNINGGLLNNTAVGNQGWGITINLTGGELRSNGGTGSTSATQLFSLGGGSAVNTLASATTSTISGRINLREGNGTPSILPFTVADGAAATDLLVSAAIIQNAGGYGISKSGAGVMTLSFTNTYTGSTTISDGTLRISSAGVLSTSPYAGAISIASGAALQYSSSAAQTLSGVITGEGALTKDTNTSDLTLSNAGNNFSGTATVSAGRISVSAAGHLSNGAASLVQSGTGQFFVNGAVTVSNPFNISGTGYAETGDSQNNIDGAIRMTGSTLSGTITLSGNSRIGAMNSTVNTINGKITGSFGIDFYGFQNVASAAPTFIISNTANDYTGATTIYNSNYNVANLAGVSTVLKLGASNVIPDGASAGNVVFAINGSNNNATDILDLNGFNETINGLTINAGTFATRITSTAAATSASVLTIGANDTTSAFSGTITDSGANRTLAITKIGNGMLTLSGVNTHTGQTTINAGTLSVSANSGLGAEATAAQVNLGGGTLSLDGTFTLENGANKRNVSLTAASGIGVTVGNTATISGTVSSTGTFGLTKSDAGTLILSGAISYSGDTVVNAGTLQFNSANANNNLSTVTISESGATLNLNYSGTDFVRKLFIGVTEMADGVYEAIGNPGGGIEIAQLTGSGTLTVDNTQPTLAGVDIVDDKSGGPIDENAIVTYTVTFSEDMDGSTVTSADFSNAGTATIGFGTVIETSPGVFSIQVTPTTGGTLRFQVNALAELRDLAGHALDTASAIPDDTTITVETDVTLPTLSGIDDGDADDTVQVTDVMTYTVTFDEDIDAATVSAADFDNDGTATITIGTINETASGVFSVQVTPTSTGTLTLRIPGTATIADVVGNALVVPVSDDTPVNVTLATLTWDSTPGGSINDGAGSWLGAGQWNNGLPSITWTSGSHAIFGNGGAGGAVTLASPTTVESLTLNSFNTTAYTLGAAGNMLTLNNGITMNSGAGAVTFSSPITLGGAQTWLNASANTLTLSSTLNNGGNLLTIDSAAAVSMKGGVVSGLGGLTKNGTGRLTMGDGTAPAHSYGGTTTLNGGVTIFGNNLGGGNLTLNGGVYEEYWTTTFIRTLGSAAGQVQILGGVSGFSENGSTSMTIKLGNGTATVVWGALNEGTATGFFNPSTLVLQSVTAQVNSTLDFQNGINLNGATRTISVLKNSNLSSAATISGSIIGTGASGLIKQGVGYLALTGANNTYAGGTTISAGTLLFNTRSSMPATGTVTVSSGATLGVTVAGSGTTWGGGTGVAGIAGLTSTVNSGEGYGSQAGSVVNFDGNSILDLNVTGNVTESNAIGDGTATSIRLIKSGTSTLTLTSGSNSYSGGTTLTAGALAIGHNSALGSGTLALNGGTIQSDSGTARTFSNAVTIGGDFTVGGTGNLTFSNTGASALGWTRQITVNTGINATFAQAFSGSTFGITKAGAGTLTLTGANTYTGVTTVSGGKLVLNNGTVSSSAVTFNASNTSMDVLGGSGVNSTWNAGNGEFKVGDNNYSNIQVLIDGKGTAGSARVIGVNILTWGRTASSSTLTLTDGGQMNVNGEIRIGNPMYSEAGGANVTIGGGTATSTFTGNSGQDFYIGYGERTGSKNNVVTVSANGLLTSIRDMYVGHINNAQNNDNPTTGNQLLVTGGTASMRGLTLGYIQTDTKDATANVVSVTSGGQLSTYGTCYIGRANNATSTSSGNTLTITGTGSSWNAGAQTIYVGYNNNATATSDNNILTVASGGVLSNVSSLVVGTGTGAETGNQVVFNGGSITATTVTVSAGNSIEIGADGGSLSGNIVNNGSAFIISSTVDVSLAGNISGSGSGITQSGSGTTTLSGVNSYSGGTTINAGMVHFTRLAAMPASGAVTVNTGTTLGINLGGAGEWTTGTSGNGTIGGLLAGLGGQSGGTVSHSGNVTLALDTTNAGSDQTYAGVIGNVGTTLGLTKLGTGTIILNQANTYTGTTTINGGTLALGANGVFADTMPLSISNATLDVATFADTVGTLDVTDTATINLGTGAALAFADSNAIEWTGGTLTLTGTFVSGSSLRFGTTSSGLTTTQLALISMSGWKNFALNSNGYLTADEAVSPTVQNVTSAKPNGTYNSGEVIDVTVEFSEPVTVDTTDGTPTLLLETGDTDRTADCISGSGTDTLTFRYTVQLGDASSDLDYTGTGALALNGGTIRDAALNDAILALPDPSAANSLGGNKALVIFTSVSGSTFRFR